MLQCSPPQYHEQQLVDNSKQIKDMDQFVVGNGTATKKSQKNAQESLGKHRMLVVSAPGTWPAAFIPGQGRLYPPQAPSVPTHDNPRLPPRPRPPAPIRAAPPVLHPYQLLRTASNCSINPLFRQYLYTHPSTAPPDAGALSIRVSERSRRAFPSTIGRRGIDHYAEAAERSATTTHQARPASPCRRQKSLAFCDQDFCIEQESTLLRRRSAIKHGWQQQRG